ncbi:MAG: fused MFS/spermidine synthase [Nitrospiraceae bacterium]
MTLGPSVPPSFRFFLLMTAFVTGAVVMALEILGSRLLAPVFGNSLFVWGALIGVILAAMSSGYAFGGWMSDRYPGGRVLAGLLLFSGSWTFLLAWSGQPVMFKVSALTDDPRWGPCLAAGVLLAPPAFGLSGVLPALLRLAILDIEHLGRHTGRMIAFSTVGSLIGTWGTAFFLLSWLGTVTLVAWLGGIQIFLGLLWLWHCNAFRSWIVTLVVAVVALLGWSALHPIQMLPDPVYQEDSPYQQVRVREDDLFRYLILDRTFHAVMWKTAPVTLFLPYSQLMVASLALVPDPKRGLVLGHGGGSFAKWLARTWPELELDVVEVDPAVVRMAEEYFEYTPPVNHHVHVKDARMFLHSSAAIYDVIWVDVFARHLVPFHLTTTEFFSEVRAHLAPDGVVAVNLASSGEGGDRLRADAVVRTMRTVFSAIESFGVKGPWRSKQSGSENVIFFAGGPLGKISNQEFANLVGELVSHQRLPYEAQTLLASTRRDTSSSGSIALTDDFAPFDLLVGSGVGEAGPDTVKKP